MPGEAAAGGFAISVLGSGGPILNAARASSGYLVWIDGVARILIDAGGGTYERLGRAGVDLRALDLVLLTHTHIDHSGGLAPIIFSLYLQQRTRALTIVGPAGRDAQPGCAEFTDLLFGTGGAWRYLHSFEGFGIDAREQPSDVAEAAPHEVSLAATPFADGALRVRSVAVPHGMMPALAFRIEYGGRSLTFSGDVSQSTAGLIALARDTDLLIHDLALPERDLPHGDLHAKPTAVGRTAHDAGARALLTTHFMPPIEAELAPSLARIEGTYGGLVLVAHDLTTYAIGETIREMDGVAAG